MKYSKFIIILIYYMLKKTPLFSLHMSHIQGKKAFNGPWHSNCVNSTPCRGGRSGTCCLYIKRKQNNHMLQENMGLCSPVSDCQAEFLAVRPESCVAPPPSPRPFWSSHPPHPVSPQCTGIDGGAAVSQALPGIVPSPWFTHRTWVETVTRPQPSLASCSLKQLW